MSVKFSIIIPTYNRAKIVFKTIESVLEQRYDDFEIIVVDDGSTDETQELFTRFQNPKVSYFRKENGERGAARNFGARKAVGDYLSFFDSDDLLKPNHLDEALKCIQAFDRPEVFAIGFSVVDGEGRVKRVVRDLPNPMNERLFAGNVLGCSAVFVRKDIFDQVPFCETRALAGSEDWLLWLRLAARYPFRFWNQVTWSLVDHGGRSVYHFEEKKLTARSREMLAGLKADPVFMNRYADRIGQIQASREIYTGLHLALSGHVGLPFVYLGRAAATYPNVLWSRTTLGTLKHVLVNIRRALLSIG